MPISVPLPVPVNTPIRYLTRSPDSTLSHHTSNGPGSASGRPPTLDSTLNRRAVYVRHPIHTSNSPISFDVPIRHLSPIRITIFRPPSISIRGPQPPVFQPQIRHPQIYPLLHVPNNMPSSYLSGGFYEMQILILENFGGTEMGRHRGELLQRLDHVIGQLCCGLEHLKHQNPGFNEDYLQRTRHQYRYLESVLLNLERAHWPSNGVLVREPANWKSLAPPPSGP
jgi:hypothetical protein